MASCSLDSALAHCPTPASHGYLCVLLSQGNVYLIGTREMSRAFGHIA